MDRMKIEHLTKCYGNTVANDDISFTLESGKVYALCGNNGAGKTTLLKQLCHVELPSSGVILFENHPFHYLDKANIAYFADDSFFSKDTTVKQLYEIYETLFVDFKKSACKQMIASFGVNDQAALGTLSKGVRVKVELAFTIHRDVKLYVFDEPFANLDPLAREEVMKMIMKCGREDATFLIATHLISEFESYFDHLLLLKDGTLIVDASSDEIRNLHHMSIHDYLKHCLK